MGKTSTLTLAQRKQCLALGATFTEIRDLENAEFSFEEILDQCETAKAAKDQSLQADADRNAKAQKKALRPENETAPDVSAYHPNGGANKVEPRCETYWNGQPVWGDVDSDEEVTLMNQVKPGIYLCSKTDGSKFKVAVDAQFDMAGKITKLTMAFPCSGQQRHNHRSRVDILQEMLAQTPAPGLGGPSQIVPTAPVGLYA